jgi:putative FmdB family regulatory protein
MPVYEFECSDGHITEELVRMGTKSTKCSKCSKRAKKIISQCSFELKAAAGMLTGIQPKDPKAAKNQTNRRAFGRSTLRFNQSEMRF